MRSLLSAGSGMIVVLFSAATRVLDEETGKTVDPDRILSLVAQLGDDRFARRQEASAELMQVGEPALPALRTALATTDDVEVRVRAQRLVETILQDCRKSKSSGLEFALILPGEFRMGSLESESGRRPDERQHRVRITMPFLLGTYEVTQAEYQQLMKAMPSWFASTGEGREKVAGMATEQFPVERVTWFDAAEFCNRLSQQDGYPAYYWLAEVQRQGETIKSAVVTVRGGNGYRLPAEAEWEYACRARTTTRFHFGNSNSGREANVKAVIAGGYGGPSREVALGRTTKVGSYKPNPWELYDMHGNVEEWCQDWYERDYYVNSPLEDPLGPERGSHRVSRGGSWLVTDSGSRSASRMGQLPSASNYYTGFRVARTP